MNNIITDDNFVKLVIKQHQIISNILTDSQLDTRLNCGKTIREYYILFDAFKAKLEKKKEISKAKVTWSWKDINELKPNWSKKKCKNFLQEHENGIQEAMVEAGWFAIKLAIGEY